MSMIGHEAEMASLSKDSGTGTAAAASGGNPYLIAGMVGLKALEAHKKREELERQERYRAQVETSNNMQSALSKLANIGTAMRL